MTRIRITMAMSALLVGASGAMACVPSPKTNHSAQQVAEPLRQAVRVRPSLSESHLEESRHWSYERYLAGGGAQAAASRRTLQDMYAQQTRGKSGDERLRAIREMMAIAAEVEPEDPLAAIYLYRRGGRELFFNHPKDDALRNEGLALIERAIEIGGESKEVMDSLRGVGERLMSRALRTGVIEKAIVDPEWAQGKAMLQRGIELFENSQSRGFKATTWEHYTRMLSLLAFFESMAGNHDHAIELRNRWLEHEWLPIEEKNAIRILRDNALDAKASANFNQAIEWYDRIFLSFPEYGRDDGSIVYLMRERAEAHGLNELSIAHAELLEPIFHDPRLEQFVTQRINLGHQWAMALWANNKERGILAHKELQALIEKHKAKLDWTPGSPVPTIYATTLAILRGYYDSIGDKVQAESVQRQYDELFSKVENGVGREY